MTSKPQSKSQQDTTIDSEVDPYDEIIAIFDSVNLRAKPREDILKWHHKQIAQEARARIDELKNLWSHAREHTITDIEMIMHHTDGKVDFIEAVSTDIFEKRYRALTADKEQA